MQSDNSTIYFNGDWIKSSQLGKKFFDDSLHFGNGVSEEMRAYASLSDISVFRLREHHSALIEAMKVANVHYSITADQLMRLTVEAVERNGLRDATIRVVIYKTRGESRILISTWEAAPFVVREAVYVRSSTNIRDREADEDTILIDDEGYLEEDTGTNFFHVKDDVLYTPQVNKSAKIRAIRDTIIECAMKLGHPVIEKKIRPDEIDGSEVAFYSNSTSEVNILAKFDDYTFTTDWRNTMAIDLLLLFRQWATNKDLNDYTII